jgi:hypothetical protein
MKVREVVERLKDFDQEIDVVVDDIEEGFILVEMISEGFSPNRKEGESVIVIN